MSIRVSEIVNQKSLKKFNLLAGESGLTKEVSTICIADLELDKDLFPYSGGMRRGSFIISNSLIKEDNLMDALKRFIEWKAAGLAISVKSGIKPAQDILDFCNNIGFPIFIYDQEEVYFDNVVFEIMHLIEENTLAFSMEREVAKLLKGKLSQNEVEKIALSICPDFQRNVIACFVKPKDASTEFDVSRIVRNYSREDAGDDAVVQLINYKDGLIIIITMGRIDMKVRDEIIDDIVGYDVSRDKLIIASGGEHQTFEELDKAFIECNHAYIAGKIEGLDRVEYDDIGTYRFLIPNRNNPAEIAFMKKYMRKMSNEQLETAIVFIRNNGNFDKAAQELMCHRNTVRYRINKIHESTDPGKSEFQFYENLSTAIKIFLISGA